MSHMRVSYRTATTGFLAMCLRAPARIKLARIGIVHCVCAFTTTVVGLRGRSEQSELVKGRCPHTSTASRHGQPAQSLPVIAVHVDAVVRLSLAKCLSMYA